MTEKTSASKSQAEKFKDAQREHETDQSQEHFDAALKKVAKAVPAKLSPKS